MIHCSYERMISLNVIIWKIWIVETMILFVLMWIIQYHPISSIVLRYTMYVILDVWLSKLSFSKYLIYGWSSTYRYIFYGHLYIGIFLEGFSVIKHGNGKWTIYRGDFPIETPFPVDFQLPRFDYRRVYVIVSTGNPVGVTAQHLLHLDLPTFLLEI